jgi:hypothetical protein
MSEPFNVLSDTYNLYVPIEKSIEVDENGDYIVQGVMSSDDTDEEDDSISPEGMDCSYFLEKGWIKYEHGNSPNQFIGEPLEVKVGRFEHPTIKKSVNGIHVKGRLFAQRELTRQAVKTIEDLQKSNTKRTMGWSIEGNVKERDRKTGKIVKSVLRNVVLTMNPVNTTTWAELAKSFAKHHELTIDMPEMDKSMDIGAIHAVTPQSLEGGVKTPDPQDDWLNLFRSFVKQELLKKSFVTSYADDIEIEALHCALSKGLDYDEAEDFASYIAEKLPILKSIQKFIGGASMPENVKNTLSSLLDTDLEELQKSLEMDNEEDENDFENEEDEDLEKSMNEDDDEGNQDDDDQGDEGDQDDDDQGDEGDGEDDEEVEKSLRTNLSKSLAEEHGQAFEVSDFLTSLTDEIGFYLEGFEKSMGSVTKQQNTIVKSLATFGEAMQKSLAVIEAQAERIDSLEKSLNEVLNRPVGRKSVVSGREVQTLQKSIETGGQPLNRNQIGNILMKSFDKGEIPGSAIARFEAGTPLQSLGLPESLRQQLGL